MTTYNVEVEVHQFYTMEIEADSEDEAEEIAHRSYYSNDAVMTDEVVNSINVEEAD